MNHHLERPFSWYLKELVVLHCHDSWFIIVSEVNPRLLSAADLLVAQYLHLPADHHLASCLRRDLAFHFAHETFAGSSRRNVNLQRSCNIYLNQIIPTEAGVM